MSITLAMPRPPTSTATAPSPRNSVVNAVAAAALRLDRVRRPADVDRLGMLGVGRRREHRADVVDQVGLGADVDRRRGGLGTEERLGGVTPDERGAVDLRRQRQRIEDPDDAPPAVADPDQHRVAERVDPQPLGRHGAEHDRRVAVDRVVDEAAGRQRAAQRLEEVVVGRLDGDAAGLARVDLVRPPDGART